MSERIDAAYARYVQHDAAKQPQESPYYLPDGFIKFDGDAFERDCQVLAAAYHKGQKDAERFAECRRLAKKHSHCNGWTVEDVYGPTFEAAIDNSIAGIVDVVSE